MKKIELKIEDIDEGFCRVTYYTLNIRGQKIYYCLQNEGEKYGGVTLYRSTSEYEPEYQTHFKEGFLPVFERVPEYSSMAKQVNEYIDGIAK